MITPIELQGETYFSSMPSWWANRPTSFFYGVSYNIPIGNGFQGYKLDEDYEAKGWGVTGYVGESFQLTDKTDVFLKVLIGYSNTDEKLKGMPNVKLEQGYGMIQAGFRGNPFRQLGL